MILVTRLSEFLVSALTCCLLSVFVDCRSCVERFFLAFPLRIDFAVVLSPETQYDLMYPPVIGLCIASIHTPISTPAV